MQQEKEMEPLASVHADLPWRVQKKLREFILQIAEVEFDEMYPSTAALKTEGLRGDLCA